MLQLSKDNLLLKNESSFYLMQKESDLSSYRISDVLNKMHMKASVFLKVTAIKQLFSISAFFTHTEGKKGGGQLDKVQATLHSVLQE